jgi:hypothetical protein
VYRLAIAVNVREEFFWFIFSKLNELDFIQMAESLSGDLIQTIGT